MVSQRPVDLPQHHVGEVGAGRGRPGQVQEPGAQQAADLVVVVALEQQGRQVEGAVTGQDGRVDVDHAVMAVPSHSRLAGVKS